MNEYNTDKPTSKPAHDTRTIEIHFRVPKILRQNSLINKFYTKYKRLWKTSRVFRAILTILLISIITIIAFSVFFKKPSEITPDSSGNTVDSSGLITNGDLSTGTPEFDTILPSGRTIEDLGGWTRVSPPDRDPVFAFADTLGNNRLIISQQPLPESFLSDPDVQVAEMAKAFSANNTITVGETLAYIGTSAKGPQSVIFTKNGLLLLIKSSIEMSDEDWANYIRSLQ